MNQVSEICLHALALTAENFRPFGDVIEIEGRPSTWINGNTSQRFNDLGRVDVLEAGGRPIISIFRAAPRPLPFRVCSLERHPLSSQAFYPLAVRPFLVVVAPEGPLPIAQRIQAFLSSGVQGVNYRRNTWHHSLIALDETADFLVIDRGGEESNCEEIQLGGAVVMVTTSASGGR